MKYWLQMTGIFLGDLSIRIFFNWGIWTPDIVLLAVIYSALTRPMGEAYLLAFIMGIFWDAVNVDLMGMHSCLYLLMVMIVARIRVLFWAQFSISRLFIGMLLCGLVRFGEVIFWLSNFNTGVSIQQMEAYILAGAIVAGICFYLFPWSSPPIQLPERDVETLWGGRNA